MSDMCVSTRWHLDARKIAQIVSGCSRFPSSSTLCACSELSHARMGTPRALFVRAYAMPLRRTECAPSGRVAEGHGAGSAPFQQGVSRPSMRSFMERRADTESMIRRPNVRPLMAARADPSCGAYGYAEPHRRRGTAETLIRASNVRRLSGGEAPHACGSCGTPVAATNDQVGGRDLQAA